MLNLVERCKACRRTEPEHQHQWKCKDYEAMPNPIEAAMATPLVRHLNRLENALLAGRYHKCECHAGELLQPSVRKIDAAIKAYNEARPGYVISLAKRSKLGWCSYRRHWADLRQLRGVQVQGRRWRGGEYYDTVEGIGGKFVICQKCFDNLRPYRNGDEDWMNFWSADLGDPRQVWPEYFKMSEFESFLAERPWQIPPKISWETNSWYSSTRVLMFGGENVVWPTKEAS